MSELVPAPGPLEQQRGTLDEAGRATFLEALAAGWTVTHAAQLAGVHRMTVYRHRAGDTGFAEAWSDAWQAGRDALVDEARRRAFEGVPEPVYQGGKLVGAVRRYSDRLLEFLLKQRDPSFRDHQQVTVDGQVTVPVHVGDGHRVTTLGDVLRIAHELGASLPLAELGYSRRDDFVDGEAVEIDDLRDEGT